MSKKNGNFPSVRSIFIVLFFYISPCNCNNQESTITSRTQYVPLGWETLLKCDAAKQFSGVKFDPDSGSLIDAAPSIRWDFMGQNGYLLQHENKTAELLIPETEGYFHDTMFQCTARVGDRVFISKIYLVAQNCTEKRGEFVSPCAYGKCLINKTRVECDCFNQYTGRDCSVRKEYGFFFDMFNFTFIPVFLFFALISKILVCLEHRKSAKTQTHGIHREFSANEQKMDASCVPFSEAPRNGDSERRKKKKEEKLKGSTTNTTSSTSNAAVNGGGGGGGETPSETAPASSVADESMKGPGLLDATQSTENTTVATAIAAKKKNNVSAIQKSVEQKPIQKIKTVVQPLPPPMREDSGLLIDPLIRQEVQSPFEEVRTALEKRAMSNKPPPARALSKEASNRKGKPEKSGPNMKQKEKSLSKRKAASARGEAISPRKDDTSAKAV